MGKTIGEWIELSLEAYLQKSDQNNKDHLCVRCGKPAMIKLCRVCSREYYEFVMGMSLLRPLESTAKRDENGA